MSTTSLHIITSIPIYPASFHLLRMNCLLLNLSPVLYHSLSSARYHHLISFLLYQYFFFLFYWTICISMLLVLPSLKKNKNKNIIKASLSAIPFSDCCHVSLFVFIKNASEKSLFSPSPFLLLRLCLELIALKLSSLPFNDFSKYPIHKFSALSYSTHL